MGSYSEGAWIIPAIRALCDGVNSAAWTPKYACEASSIPNDPLPK